MPFYFFLPTIFETSTHFSGTPKLPSSSSTADVCFPWTITSCAPPATGETIHSMSGREKKRLSEPNKTVRT